MTTNSSATAAAEQLSRGGVKFRLTALGQDARIGSGRARAEADATEPLPPLPQQQPHDATSHPRHRRTTPTKSKH